MSHNPGHDNQIRLTKKNGRHKVQEPENGKVSYRKCAESEGSQVSDVKEEKKKKKKEEHPSWCMQAKKPLPIARLKLNS